VLVIGIVIGLVIAALLVALFVIYSLRLAGKFSELDEIGIKENVSKLLTYGKNCETLNFDEADGDAFAQFKKYIQSVDDFGVDFVFPIVGRYAGKKSQVSDICSKHNLHCEFVEAANGWFFAFIQMNNGASICDDAISAALELSELDFSKNVGVSGNSTFRWGRKGKVLGNQKLSKDAPSRYDIEPDPRSTP